uniref:Retropepsins domain-containing protein n=1 Tax=Trichogramma kaykai TaxID=54128 RepID=A0ABD2VTC5_9HYME
MGADFVLLNRVEIDFGSKKLTIQDKSFKLFFEDQPLLKQSKTTLANYRQPYISKLMPYIKINLYVYQAMLLLDTGAQISVIYQRVIPKGLNINSTKKLTVEDINGQSKETLGRVTIMLCEIPTIFHVVDETFDLPGDGILGVNFFHLSKAKLNFESLLLNANNYLLEINIGKTLADPYEMNLSMPPELNCDFYDSSEDNKLIELIDLIPDSCIFTIQKEKQLKDFINVDKLDETEKLHVQEILNKYSDIFHIPDHQPLVWFKTADLNTRVQKWRFKISVYDYSIVYKKGKLNVNADSLSRNVPEELTEQVVCSLTRSKLQENESIQNIDGNSRETVDAPRKRGRPPKNLQKSKPDIPPRNPSKRIIKPPEKFDPSNYIKPPEPDPKSFEIPPSESEKSDDSDSERESTDDEEQQSNEVQHLSDDAEQQPDEVESQPISNDVEQQLNPDNIDKLIPEIVYSKNLMHCLAGNIAYFIDTKSNPCDAGAKKLAEFNKLPRITDINTNEVHIFESSKKTCHFALCIKNEDDIAPTTCKENILFAMSVLRNLLEKRNQTTIFCTKTNTLYGLSWDDIMEGIIILCCLIVVALSSPQLYLNEKIEDNPGIYYERTENIRYYAASWDIVVFIDTYELHKILPEMRRAIAFTTKTCKDPEMSSKSLHRIKHIENRIELLDLHFNRTLSSLYNIPPRQPVDNLKNLQKRSVPFGFIGNAAKYLFGTLTEEDSEKYDDQIKDLQLKQLELARIGKDDSHLIHNKLNDITKRIQKEKNDIKKAMIELNKTAYHLYSLSSDYYRWSYISDVNLALNEVESVLNLFDDTLRNLLDIISYAKVNLLHPELITPEQLHKVIRQIEDHGKDLEFPIPIDSARIEKLSNLADISLGYHDDNLIFHVNIPLLEKYITNLYKMHPLPIPQNLQGIYIATSIRPRWKYIAINEHSKVYSFLNEDDLQNCKHDKRRKVCPKKHMMIEMSSKADCEYLLLHKPSLVNFSECDVVITHEKRDTWIHLDSVNGWLYSLKENHSLLITCEKGMTYVILKGAGILQLKPKCQAKYKDISITQQEGIGESVQYFYTPHVSLNISTLDSKLPEKVNLVLPSMTEEYLDDSTEIDMKEIQRRYDQLTEETSTDKLHKYTTYGSLLTLLILMIFAGIAIFIIYKLNEQYRFEIRQKTNSPRQVNVSTQSLNEMEQ